jgi:signal transduction histidine kinase
MTDELERRTSSMIRLVNSTIRSVQRISSELRPSLLDDLGLEAAIEWQAREFEQRSGVACTLDLNASRLTIDAARSTALFRIFQETLTNIARHANAKHVDIRLSEEDGSVHLRVRDDGIGIESETNSESLGIMGMRERALLAGGTLSIESEPESGTIVSVVMPVEENLSPSIR